jgi:CHAT domain-containing protein/tetratricopeptide (TPR) repeat protein
MPLLINAQTDVLTLEKGISIEKEISAKESHTYQIISKGKQTLTLNVKQQGIDLVINLADSKNRSLEEFNSNKRTNGFETLFVVLEAADQYLITVRPAGSDIEKGKYAIRLLNMRDTEESDYKEIKIRKLTNEGDQLLKAASYLEAIKRYEEAQRIAVSINSLDSQISTLKNIGDAYDKLGEQAKRIEYYERSLPLFNESLKQSIDKTDYRVKGIGLAATLSHIGLLYSMQKDTKRSLDYYNRAIKVYKEMGDQDNEAMIRAMNLGVTYESLGEYQKAIENYEQAAEVFQKSNHLLLPITLYRSANCYEAIGDYKRAIDTYKQGRTVSEQKKDFTWERFSIGRVCKLYQKLGENQAALDCYKEELSINQKSGKKEAELYTLRTIGSIYRVLGDNSKALDYYQQALKIADDSKQEDSYLIGTIGEIYESLGEKQKALEYKNRAKTIKEPRKFFPHSVYIKFVFNKNSEISWVNVKKTDLPLLNQALQIAQKSGNRYEEAGFINNIGNVYLEFNEFQNAIEQYTKALEIWRSINNKKEEAGTLSNLGLVYEGLSDNQKAIQYFIQALDLSQKTENRHIELRVHKELADLYKKINEPQKAIDHYNYVLLFYKTTDDYTDQAFTLGNIGSLYSSLKQYEKALDFYGQSLQIYQTLKDLDNQIMTITRIGYLYEKRGLHRDSLNYFKQALHLLRQVGNRDREAEALLRIGKTYEKLEENQNALEAYTQMLKVARAIGDRQREAEALENIGRINRLLGIKEKASNAFKELIKLRTITKDRAGEASAIFLLAEAEYDSGNLQESLKSIKDVINIVESLRSNYINPDQRSIYLASVQNYYSFFISLLMKLHREYPDREYNKQALEIVERARARGLIDMLIETKANIREGISTDLILKERELQNQLNTKSQEQIKLLSKKHTDKEAKIIADEIESIVVQYEEVQAAIRRSSPKFSALDQPQPLKADQIQKQLDKDTILLEYALGNEESYLWMVTVDQVHSYTLPKKSEIEPLAKQVYSYLSSSSKKDDIEYKRSIAALSKILINPIADRLNKKRLLIVTTGILQYIPYAALPNPKLSNDQPLIVDHEIINLPSSTTLSILRNEFANPSRADKRIAVIADPVFDIEDSRINKIRLVKDENALGESLESNRGIVDISRSETDFGLETLPNNEKTLDIPDDLLRSAKEVGLSDTSFYFPRLIASRQEAKNIVAMLPSNEIKQALDFDASRTLITGNELSQYRIVHFATHGLLNDTTPHLSGLVLSLVDKNGQAQDGFLRLHEIYNMRLQADLVVLSACQTGLGKDVQGEGLIGLTRAFMYAGTKQVLSSLWKIDDRATAELMKLFYEGILKKELQPSAALRDAQIRMWRDKQWNQPYKWAGFIIQGVYQ